MTDDDDIEAEARERAGLAREQLGLGLVDPNKPFSRADCPVERPCTRYGCRYNNHVETERPGRPYGGRAPEPKLFAADVRARIQSCELDLAARGGMETADIARETNTSPRRVLQVEARALLKVKVATMLEEVLDEHLRSKLPPGAEIETVYPRNADDAGHVHVVLVFRVPQPHVSGNGKVSTLVTIRKRKP